MKGFFSKMPKSQNPTNTASVYNKEVREQSDLIAYKLAQLVISCHLYFPPIYNGGGKSYSVLRFFPVLPNHLHFITPFSKF